ncbi:MAG: hypothetical protein KDD27_25835 [Saprospiraceae bacterium]|nr:hypothetical protein [Saprospiraceae bacterium]
MVKTGRPFGAPFLFSVSRSPAPTDKGAIGGRAKAHCKIRLAPAYSQDNVAARQRLHDEIADLEKAGPPKLDPTRIEELKSQIQKARQEAAIRQDEKREALELKKQGELAGLQETRFTGIVTWVDMYGK